MIENTDHSLTKQQTFLGYLKHPEEIDISDEKLIGSLVERFPYAQTLHSFQAKCYNDTGDFDKYLSKAALYAPDRNILYHIIHKPETLTVKPALTADPAIEERLQESGDLQEDIHTLQISPEISDLTEIEAADYNIIEDDEAEKNRDSDPPVMEEISDITEYAEPETVNAAEDTAGNQGSTQKLTVETPPGDSETERYPDDEPDTPMVESKVDDTRGTSDETEKQIISNIASSDFFRFQEKIDDRFTSHIHNEHPGETSEQKKSDAQSVSKYDDDTMPYTFLWWLNKTRKEHSDTYQPYVSFKLDTTEDIKKEAAPDLNRQIIENIFHLQSPLEDMPEEKKPQTVEFTLKRKDDQIIERFIREEPQIKPPRPEKLDTENKARKSSEDSNDMVSETLAQVYIEQMLFNKAIDTYKKLSLKFPEKSAYFADQIRKLEITNKE